MIDSSRWPEVREHFERLLDAPAVKRARELELLSAEDSALAEEVERLLELDQQDGEAFEEVSLAHRCPTLVRETLEGEAPTTAGEPVDVPGWEVLEVLGRGGMGTVHRARRAGSQQRAAVKILHAHLRSDWARHRFETEREVLGRLEHPGIARLIDGGIARDGRPFLAMELVEGRRIDHHCRESHLTTAERLQLIRDVCDAVDFAHRQLVVHRDLKPSNLMVDDRGRVRLLDFGVATLLEDIDGPTTLEGFGPMTPGYAAPERLRGERVTTASDVYSLGVITWELLTGGRPPSDPGEQRETLKREATIGADLRAILLRSIAAAPADRYQRASDLGDDLTKLLEGHPVHANRIGTWGRLTRLIRRNRVASSAVAVAVVLASIGAIMVAEANGRFRRERTSALAEAARARAALAYLERILARPVSSTPNGDEITEVLRDAETRLASELVDEPAVRLDLLRLLNDQYLHRALYEEASRISGSALDLLNTRPEFADDDELLYEVLNRHGYSLVRAGRPRDGVEFLQRALDLAVANHGPRSSEALTSMRYLSYAGGIRHPSETLELRRRILEAERERAGSEDSDELAQALSDHARSVYFRGDVEAAFLEMREALDILQRQGGSGADRAFLHTHLAAFENGRGRPREAADQARQAIDLFEAEDPGGGGSSRARAHAHLGVALVSLGQIEPGLDAARQGHELLLARPVGDAVRAESLRLLGGAHCLAQRFEAGIGHLREARNLLRREFPADGWRVARIEGTLGLCLEWSGTVETAAEASSLRREAAERVQSLLGPASPVRTAILQDPTHDAIRRLP